jgi:hypothetical protein
MNHKPTNKDLDLQSYLTRELGALKDLLGGWEAASQAMADLKKQQEAQAVDKSKAKETDPNKRKISNGNKTR